MVFIRDTELVLRATVELVNTLPHTDTTGVDTLVSPDQLDDFARRAGLTRDEAARRLAQVPAAGIRRHRAFHATRTSARH